MTVRFVKTVDWEEDPIYPVHAWEQQEPWSERMICSFCGKKTTFAILASATYGGSLLREECPREEVSHLSEA